MVKSSFLRAVWKAKLQEADQDRKDLGMTLFSNLKDTISVLLK